MLVSFTGAQSTGKTTLLNQCCAHPTFRKFHCIPEVTRKVAREQNVDINEAGDDITQLFILNEHLHNHHIKGDALLDRCIIDGVVYTQYLYNQKRVCLSVMEYAEYVFETLLPKLDIIFYTSPKDIPIEDDGQRSIDKAFRDNIINEFEDTLYYIESQWDNEAPNIIRLEGDVNTRMETILKTINNHDHKVR